MDYHQIKRLDFRRKFFKLFGAEITVTDTDAGSVVGFISAKAWKLREDVRLYTGPDKQQEVLRIHARNVIDFGGTYDVYIGTDEVRFSLRRKGLRSSFVRDHWLVQDSAGATMAEIVETSGGLALFRRWVGIIPIVGEIIDLALGFAPQSYRITDPDDKLIATITHRKNPFIVKLALDRTQAETESDPYYGITACALLSIIDADK